MDMDWMDVKVMDVEEKFEKVTELESRMKVDS
jgi:hypothetical protein